MSDVDLLATNRAATQHGVISRSQATALGMTRRAIQHRVASGRWVKCMPSVYVIRGAPLTWHARLLAACLETGGVASHRSSAVLRHISGFAPGMPELSVPRGHARELEGIRLHESTDLHLAQAVHVAGIPTTSTARLAVDLGAVVPFANYESAMYDLLGRKLLTWDDALNALLRHSKQGRNGVGALRALITERYGEDVAESALERAFYKRFRDLAFPAPTPQVEIRDEHGFIARVDYAYPDKKIAIELDGRRFHLTAEAFEADRAKRNRLKLAGWLVLEFTWRMLIDRPESVYRQIEKAYRSR
jgi:very-short-patch-repair endonuclease